MYEGSYAPLAGAEMSDRLRLGAAAQPRRAAPACSCGRCTTGRRSSSSARSIIHLLRMFLTAAYRRPRRINWLIGLGLLLLVGLERPDGLLAARRPALRHRPAHRLLHHRVDPVPRAGAGVAPVRRRVPDRRPHRPHLPGAHLPAAGGHRRAARRAPRPALAAAAHAVPGAGAERPHHRRHADGAGLRPAHHRLPPARRRRLHRVRRLRADQPGVAVRARTAPGTRPRRRSPTGTWAGSRAPCA